MCPPVTVVLESTASIQVVAVSPVVNITTEQTWINTILGTSTPWKNSSLKRRSVSFDQFFPKLDVLWPKLSANCWTSYFGKVGMRHFHLLRNHYWKPSINLDKLWSLVPEETREAYVSGKKTDTAPVLDLLPLGYSKVLGKGRIPKIPIVVRARWFSKEAERKIKEAGGVVELVA
ncbi:60S ribosomal protein L27a [Fonsecaea nubica]|uniref:Large ribosomal subunit protein uL15 n=1 Tax=Fonsecaea nubica TaxID=856822 RepID=A0A178C8H6_9EURO|nr:60S ribosomal protein L27a [Fonsecaea nubica]OAL26268.1 60S ribosomal protein L27a [Fonsecaea nubica]